ncbi:hypothetical protein KIF59_14090 [Enterobacter cloacae subsp. cloacae]|nr:hypothetical protein [Enterobacter cloacae subsp. cloacae]
MLHRKGKVFVFNNAPSANVIAGSPATSRAKSSSSSRSRGRLSHNSLDAPRLTGRTSGRLPHHDPAIPNCWAYSLPAKTTSRNARKYGFILAGPTIVRHMATAG